MEPDRGAAGGREGDAPAIRFEDTAVDISDIRPVDWPGLVAFWLLALVVFLQFFTRYVLNDSLAWTEEVARYLLILVCFLGSVSAARRGSHIMLEFLIRAAPGLLGKAMAVLSGAISLGFFAAMTWIGVELTQRTRQKMVTLPVPKAWIYWVCVVSLGLMAFYSAIWLWRRLRATPDQIRTQLDHGITSD